MTMLPISSSFMPQATISPVRPEARAIPFDHADHHHIDGSGAGDPIGMELADIYGAILVVVPLGILVKSLLL